MTDDTKKPTEAQRARIEPIMDAMGEIFATLLAAGCIDKPDRAADILGAAMGTIARSTTLPDNFLGACLRVATRSLKTQTPPPDWRSDVWQDKGHGLQ